MAMVIYTLGVCCSFTEAAVPETCDVDVGELTENSWTKAIYFFQNVWICQT